MRSWAGAILNVSDPSGDGDFGQAEYLGSIQIASVCSYLAPTVWAVMGESLPHFSQRAANFELKSD